eukprot:9095278-Karenia_brevis.AAC.1
MHGRAFSSDEDGDGPTVATFDVEEHNPFEILVPDELVVAANRWGTKPRPSSAASSDDTKKNQDKIQLHYRLLEEATDRADDPEEVEAIDA